jgi:hypothetical protein
VNIGGWGPREGVAALAFGAAGLGAAQGLTVAVVYGVLAFVAGLPGAVVLMRQTFPSAVRASNSQVNRRVKGEAVSDEERPTEEVSGHRVAA